jgi:hypothetical protein
LPTTPTTLSRTLGVLPRVPDRRTAGPAIPITCRPSPIVVRRQLLFTTGAVRGLRTLEWKLLSFWLFTIRLAWLAVKRFSFGGEPDIVAAVGLLRL